MATAMRSTAQDTIVAPLPGRCVPAAIGEILSGPGIRVRPYPGEPPATAGLSIDVTPDPGDLPLVEGPAIRLVDVDALPFLAIDGQPIPIAWAQPTYDEVLIGAARRTFNGHMRSGIRTRFRNFHLVTPLLPIHAAQDLILYLQRPGPFPCDGWLFANRDVPVRCFVGPVNGNYSMIPDRQQLMTLEFDLLPVDKSV